jgi:hypothetical protein
LPGVEARRYSSCAANRRREASKATARSLSPEISTVRTTTRNIAIGIFTVACWVLGSGAVPAHAQAAAPQATSPNALALHIFQDAAVNARAANARLAATATPAPRTPPGNVQYQDALAKLQAGQFLEAIQWRIGELSATEKQRLRSFFRTLPREPDGSARYRHDFEWAMLSWEKTSAKKRMR